MNELALFAGAGGGILAGKLLGWTTVGAVEIEDYPRRVLLQRQADGILPKFPIWDNIKTFNGKPWRGVVDVVSGGFPCQDISVAGKGAGIEGERSGLWSEMARVIREVRPRFAFVENSPLLVSRGLGTVVSELVEMGFDCRWGVFSACSIGGPHTRDRLFIVANANKSSSETRLGLRIRKVEDFRSWALWGNSDQEREEGYFKIRMETQPGGVGVDDVFSNRVDRLAAIGNAQVPAVAALAWQILSQRLHNTL